MRLHYVYLIAAVMKVGVLFGMELTPDKLLVRSAKQGDGKQVQAALDAGAHPNAKNKNGIPALTLAAMANDLETVNILLNHGADPNAEDASGQRAIDKAMYERAKLQSAAMLQEAGNKIHAFGKLGRQEIETYTKIIAELNRYGSLPMQEATRKAIAKIEQKAVKAFAAFQTPGVLVNQEGSYGVPLDKESADKLLQEIAKVTKVSKDILEKREHASLAWLKWLKGAFLIAGIGSVFKLAYDFLSRENKPSLHKDE